MRASAAGEFAFALAYIRVMAWLWFGFFRQFWPSAGRALARGQAAVAAWVAFCWQVGLGARARRESGMTGVLSAACAVVSIWPEAGKQAPR